jgi:hypothetical protein
MALCEKDLDQKIFSLGLRKKKRKPGIQNSAQKHFILGSVICITRIVDESNNFIVYVHVDVDKCYQIFG